MLDGSRLTGRGRMAVTGSYLQWEDATIDLDGTLALGDGTEIDIAGQETRLEHGDITLPGSGTLAGRLTMNAGRLLLGENASVDLQADIVGSGETVGTPSIENAGRILLRGAGGNTQRVEVPFTNAGSVELSNRGDADFLGGYTQEGGSTLIG